MDGSWGGAGQGLCVGVGKVGCPPATSAQETQNHLNSKEDLLSQFWVASGAGR